MQNTEKWDYSPVMNAIMLHPTKNKEHWYKQQERKSAWKILQIKIFSVFQNEILNDNFLNEYKRNSATATNKWNILVLEFNYKSITGWICCTHKIKQLFVRRLGKHYVVEAHMLTKYWC